ncbi:MAG: hypothetical protein AAGF12_23455 [Myxococcota bacterium]
MVYDRILMVQGQAADDSPPTGEVDVSELEAHHEAGEADEGAVAEYSDGSYDPDYPSFSDHDEATRVAIEGELAPHLDAAGDRPSQTNPPPANPDWTESPYEAETAVAAAAYNPDEAPADADYEEGFVHAETEVAYDDSMATAIGEAPGVAERQYQASGDEAYIDASPTQAVEFGEDQLSALDASGDAEFENVPVDDVQIDMGSVPASAPPPPAQPAGFAIQPPVDGQILVRPSVQASWHPAPLPVPESRPDAGYFSFQGGLPLPAEPPRPEIDPSMRVQRAPQPQPEADVAPAANEQPAYGEPGYEEPAYEEAGYNAPEAETAPAPEEVSDTEVPADELEGHYAADNGAGDFGAVDELPPTGEPTADGGSDDMHIGDVPDTYGEVSADVADVSFSDSEAPIVDDYDPDSTRVDVELPDET